LRENFERKERVRGVCCDEIREEVKAEFHQNSGTAKPTD